MIYDFPCTHNELQEAIILDKIHDILIDMERERSEYFFKQLADWIRQSAQYKPERAEVLKEIEIYAKLYQPEKPREDNETKSENVRSSVQ
jgi:hypothetical protein